MTVGHHETPSPYTAYGIKGAGEGGRMLTPAIVSAAIEDALSPYGVTITSLMPGPTETNFFHRADMDDTKVGASSKDSAEQVAKQGFEALMKGDKKIIAGGLGTKAQGMAAKVLPDSVKGAMHRQMAEPGSAE